MKYLIIGAGPAGLTLANKLIQNGKDDVLVLEKESEAGGLCRSKDIDGSPLDIGGGHFLDVRNPKVLDFVFEFMPIDEWDRYVRDSRIVVNGNTIGSPIEANIWQMKLSDQVEYLKAIAVAGCNLSEEMPEKFVDWIYWKLGKKIAEDYMIPYNQKMFGEDLNSLGTYWLNKLPNVSFDETLISCLEKKAYGTQPGHAEFYYPKKYGYGEVWLRMAERLGDKIIYNEPVESIDLDRKIVNGKYEADIIINTAPWKAFKEIKGLPDNLKQNIEDIKYSSTVINYVGENLDTEAQWIYYPDPSLDYHRILVRHNFCPNSKGYWTETNLTR
ncbi:MAG: FAD-dependent oxidoreductase, partial [Bacillota bacterium]|nr:FAD-dependent oxidoreductase [Bacillota bacterium]